MYNTAISLRPQWAVQAIQCLKFCGVQRNLYCPWAVENVQNLSAFRVELKIYFTYGQYEIYRISVPVKYS